MGIETKVYRKICNSAAAYRTGQKNKKKKSSMSMIIMSIISYNNYKPEVNSPAAIRNAVHIFIHNGS